MREMGPWPRFVYHDAFALPVTCGKCGADLGGNGRDLGTHLPPLPPSLVYHCDACKVWWVMCACKACWKAWCGRGELK